MLHQIQLQAARATVRSDCSMLTLSRCYQVPRPAEVNRNTSFTPMVVMDNVDTDRLDEGESQSGSILKSVQMVRSSALLINEGLTLTESAFISHLIGRELTQVQIQNTKQETV